MNSYDFKDIEDGGLCIYRYIRGSHAYGLQKDDGTSDVDEGGVYMSPKEQILGLGLDFQEDVSDERHDTTWFSLKKFLTLLIKSNPNALEALFVPDRCVLYEAPIMTEIKKRRDMFLTKKCFDSFISYSLAQIKKSRGLNKKIVQPVEKRKEPLDFCFAFYKQGSIPIKEWLANKGLKQEYCGLVNIPNMYNCYGVYYDWGNHFINEKIAWNGLEEAFMKPSGSGFARFFADFCGNGTIESVKECFDSISPIGYKGIVGMDGASTSLRLSSVKKYEIPICYVNYNEDGYKMHCKKYAEYQEWVSKRNPERYKENVGKEFDRKNMAHTVRLLHMGLEIAKGEGMKVDRSDIDRDFIMSIRMGDSTYDEIMSYVEQKYVEMQDVMAKSTIRDEIDIESVNEFYIDSVTKFFNM